MSRKDFEELRKSLIAMMSDLKRAKKSGEEAVQFANSIGGPIQEQLGRFMERFEALSHECLKLEQETREI